MAKKIRVGFLFGGRSAEHEVSLRSAKRIIDNLDTTKYEAVPIGIDKAGRWHLCASENFLLNADDPKRVALNLSHEHVMILPKEEKGALVSFSGKTTPHIDVIFPVLHGTYGEDGSMQGLLKLADIPFVGAGITGSSLGMDKDVMKRLLRDAKIPIAKFLVFNKQDEISFEAVKQELGLPLFVKPANLGSSVGVTKVKNVLDFEKAKALAFQYDKKILVEEFIEGSEVECSIIGNSHPIASMPCRVIAKDEFYTYEAKYLDGLAIYEIPLKEPQAILDKIKRQALQAFKVLCCEGLARVDMFLKKNGEVLINEINTMPGFTLTSVYPMLWEASGFNLTEVSDRLIQLAIERHEEEKRLTTTFKEIWDNHPNQLEHGKK